MDDLDAALSRLALSPAPPGLEDRVFARIAAQPAARTGLGLVALTVAAALVIGVAGAGLLDSTAAAVSPLSPLAPDPPLAPSTLLVGAL